MLTLLEERTLLFEYLTEISDTFKYVTHGSRIIRRYHVSCIVHPKHIEIIGILFVSLGRMIYINAFTFRLTVIIFAYPIHLLDPICGAECGTNQIKLTGQDSYLDRRFIQ